MTTAQKIELAVSLLVIAASAYALIRAKRKNQIKLPAIPTAPPAPIEPDAPKKTE